MKRFTILGASILLLGGCALPVPIQIASWALDGISYLTTQKSVADHGLSLIAQQDCAILRALLAEGDFCRDFDDPVTVLADADQMLETGFVANDATAGLLAFGDGGDPADFDTAAGGVPESANGEEEFSLQGYPLEIQGEPAAAGEEASLARPATTGGVVDDLIGPWGVEEWEALTLRLAQAASRKTSMVTEPGGEPETGLYFVIGSFRQHLNAKKLRNQYRVLTPSVLAAKLHQGTVFRVVVGPFVEGDAQQVHKAIFQAGITDSWAIRVKPGEWSMTMVDPPAQAPLLAQRSPEKRELTALDFIQQLAQLIY